MWPALWAFTVDFWRFRKGPEDFPHHPDTLRLLVFLSAGLATLRLALAVPWLSAAVAAGVSLAFMLWLVRQWLNRMQLGNRWLQTVGSLMVIQSVFDALTWYPAYLLAPSIKIISETGQVPANMPLLPLLISASFELWAFFLSIRTLQGAMNLKRGMAAVVTVALVLTTGLLRQMVVVLLGG